MGRRTLLRAVSKKKRTRLSDSNLLLGNMMDDVKYRLALATLDAHIGIRFNELQTAQSASEVDKEQVVALKLEFEGLHTRRDHLREATDEELQILIDDLGPKVRKAVEEQRNTPGA